MVQIIICVLILIGNGEIRHDWIMVQVVVFNLVCYFLCVLQRLGYVSIKLCHFLTGLEPFLLGIPQPCRIVKIFPGIQADQSVMCFRILLVHEMHIIGRYQFYPFIESDLHQPGVDLFLFCQCVIVVKRVACWMSLQLQVEIISECFQVIRQGSFQSRCTFI